MLMAIDLRRVSVKEVVEHLREYFMNCVAVLFSSACFFNTLLPVAGMLATRVQQGSEQI